MYSYKKLLNYPINITKKNPKLASYLITQFGGPNGELNAALRYFCQKFSMPDDRGKALLNDIATEELGHCEMIATLVKALTKDATLEELAKYNLDKNYVENSMSIYPTDCFGNKYMATFDVFKDPIVNLIEDMAAEAKARKVYENLIDITNDPEVISVLLFLREREIIHFNRFKELKEYYESLGY